MATLLLRLGAPLQSWGISSLYDTRGTDSYPTKSGVVGMLAAAMGRRRDEPVEDLAGLRFGIRIDAPGKLIHDYQVTDMGEKLNANISDRLYLSDALFLAGLSCEDENFLHEISDAVNHPVFPLFLGRRSCPVTLPLNLGIRDTGLYAALQEEPWLVPEWRQKRLLQGRAQTGLRIVMDAEEDHGAVRKDLPVSFSPFRREYGYHYVADMPARIVQNEGLASVGEHDPMKELGV